MEKLRNAPLPCPDLCTKLFDGVTATGIHSWGPSSTLPHHVEGSSEHDIDDVQYTHMETDLPPISEESSGCSKRKASSKTSKEARRKTTDDDLKEVGNEYDTTFLLFGERAAVRKVWLRLKPASCESWVRNAGRKFGLFG